MITIYWRFSVTTPHRWVWPPVGIAACVGSTFLKRSYYCYISSLFFSQHNGVVSPSPLLIAIFWIFLWFLLTDECDHLLGSLLRCNYFSEAIILSPYIMIFFLPAQWRSFTVTVADFLFWSFSMIPPHGWLQPLVGVAGCIGSTFLSDHIIAILILWSLVLFEVIWWAI